MSFVAILPKTRKIFLLKGVAGGASSPVALLRFSHACSGDDISAVLSENEVLVGVTSGVLDR